MTTDTLPTVAPVSAPDPDDVAALVRAQGILVSLEVTTWSGRRLDRRVTTDTTDREGADRDAGRFNKNLLGGKVPSFAAVVAAASAARAAHYEQTLPWADEGSRLLPTANYLEYTRVIREQRDAFKRKVDAFLAEYPQLVQDAAARLGNMFNSADYPTTAAVAQRFSYRIAFTPVPAGEDIRLNLPDHVTAHMQKGITARVERSVQAAVRDGWDRLYASVERIRDRLQEITGADPDGPQGRLHASLFSGAVETAETLRRLNILGDPQLDAMADRIVRELSQLDPKEIRKAPDAMQATADAADAILSAMAGIYGGPAGAA